MSNLVEVRNQEIYADSGLVARKFGMKHNNLVRNIKVVIKKLSKLRGAACTPKYYTDERIYRGQKFTAYMMSREFFSLVAMRLESQKAFEWQVKFNSAFYIMEKRLLQVEANADDIEWTQTRLIGKTARKEETNIINEFIKYATAHGSKNANFYYKHITNATYKALDLMSQKNPKLRDEMNIYQISELMLAERLATTRIKRYMELDINYKDIYAAVKTDLIAFSNSLRLTKAA